MDIFLLEQNSFFNFSSKMKLKVGNERQYTDLGKKA